MPYPLHHHAPHSCAIALPGRLADVQLQRASLFPANKMNRVYP
ncbi:hypothetical protein [Leptolyngbya sp. O-77]|nr:hypothetical protein [Leptolyngbya sp. O-77]